MQTIRLLTNEHLRLQTKLRHVDIHCCWLRQEVQRNHISLTWTPTATLLADGFTKALTTGKHQEFVRSIGLVDRSSQAAVETASPEGGV